MSTTIRVSIETLKMLESVKKELGLRSIDETIRELIKARRRALIRKVFGIDKGRISSFTEEDRLEACV